MSDPKAFPVQVTLCFRNKKERDYFIGQLTDGFGENEANVMPVVRGQRYNVDPTASDGWEHFLGKEARAMARLMKGKP